MRLDELFNDKFDGEYGDDRTDDYDKLRVKNTFFTVDDVRYEVRFVDHGKGRYEINYGYADAGKERFQPGALTSGSAVKVISKVVAIAEHFINKFDPDTVKFTGDKENKLASVYHQLTRVILPRVEKLGYSILTNSGRSAVYFVITKDKSSVPAHYKTVEKKSKVSEAFDRPEALAPSTARDPDDSTVMHKFEVNSVKYYIGFEHLDGNGNWTVTYGYEGECDPWSPKSRDPENKQEGSKEPFKVLSTVVAYVERFLKQEKPKSLSFSGEKYFGLDKVYRSMTSVLHNRIASLGYELATKSDSVSSSFYIHNKEATLPRNFEKVTKTKSKIDETVDMFYEAFDTKPQVGKDRITEAVQREYSRSEVSKIIRKLIGKFGDDAWGINNGNCGVFAYRLAKVLGSAAKKVDSVTTYKDGTFPGHSWVEYNGYHYDAESPYGEKEPRDMQYHKRLRAIADSEDGEDEQEAVRKALGKDPVYAGKPNYETERPDY